MGPTIPKQVSAPTEACEVRVPECHPSAGRNYLVGLDPSAPEDLEGLASTSRHAHHLIDVEISAGIEPNRIFLGGFSQGGPVALYAALSYPQPLGGVICLSGFLLPRDSLPQPIRPIPGLNEANALIPVFIGHGKEDPNVPFSTAEATANALRRFDSNVVFRAYAMGHSSCEAELRDLKQFIWAIAAP